MPTRKPSPFDQNVSIPVGPVRFDEHLYAELRKAAERDGRTVANYIRQAVKEKIVRELKQRSK